MRCGQQPHLHHAARTVLDALTLAEKGLTAAEICVQLESTAYNASIYLAVNTLELLKRAAV